MALNEAEALVRVRSRYIIEILETLNARLEVQKIRDEFAIRNAKFKYLLEQLWEYFSYSGEDYIMCLVFLDMMKRFFSDKGLNSQQQAVAILHLIRFDEEELKKLPVHRFQDTFPDLNLSDMRPLLTYGCAIRCVLPQNIKNEIWHTAKMFRICVNTLTFFLEEYGPAYQSLDCDPPLLDLEADDSNSDLILVPNSKPVAEVDESNLMPVLMVEYENFSSRNPSIRYKDFYTTIMQILKSDPNKEDALCDFLGYESLDFIEWLLVNANQLCRMSIDHHPSSSKVQEHFKRLSDRQPPNIAATVTVQTEEEKRLMKKVNKLQKSLKNDKNQDLSLQETSDQYKEELFFEHAKPLFGKVKQADSASYPHVHDLMTGSLSQRSVLSGKMTLLPHNAIRKITPDYEEIIIPAAEKEECPKVFAIPVGILDELGQMVFSEIEQFNPIQSEVFPIAYHTNENMLICAPTGAGKTNTALMAIVREIKANIEDRVVHLDKFKIVYICPMKALASEITRNFSKKLDCLGVTVKEVTGDMQLTRKEISSTQILVSTPEKWDVISRKGQADNEVIDLLKLLIIDEVHLLNGDRGPVIEALVARTLRQVVSSQSLIRIIGLSATLPSYLDVARFLRVNPEVGLFFFDNRYRPVPLKQSFLAIKSQPSDYTERLNSACFDKVIEFLEHDQQVLVFVHARNQTVATAEYLKQEAGKRGKMALFQPPKRFKVQKIEWRTKFLGELLSYGLGVHHAGLPRLDRNEVERAFMNGTIRVLVSTSTLAWGVNLPAHGVIIKGTQMYDTKKCAYVDIDILDVMQIFGRAGRPQFDTSGHAIIITTNSSITHYLNLLTNQVPIESKFLNYLTDHLNAEIVLGTVSNIQEGVEWMTFTYLYRRIRLNPLVYGLSYMTLWEDPNLRETLLKYVHSAAKELDKAHMIRYSSETGDLMPTNMGRTASYFYINFDTIQTFNELITPHMTESNIINMMCLATEYKQVQVRQEELDHLDDLAKDFACFALPGGPENTEVKVNILMQTYLSRGYIKHLSLASDMEYITQSAARIARALFNIALHKNLAVLAGRCLMVAQMFEQRMWPFEHPLKQYPDLPPIITQHLEHANMKIDDLREMDEKEIGNIIRNYKYGFKVKQYAEAFPYIEIDSTVQPITRGVVRIRLFLKPTFKWSVTGRGAVEVFWVWVEDPENDFIYHSETCTITKNICVRDETVELIFTIPLTDPRPSQYIVRVSSDKWLHAIYSHGIPISRISLPESFMEHTPLLELMPLEISVLNNIVYESLYNFTHFNPIQTQIFHCLYHTDNNVLLGAPTGSGKTIAAEIAMFRLFNNSPQLKVVYIAPLKALVRERVTDWKKRLEGVLNKKVVEITGDVTPRPQSIREADIIITTPEKWDGMSRGWQTREYIRDVGLMIIDEIHLLGEDRGPVLEVIVSRTNFIKDCTGRDLRIIGLSTAMANAKDLADWLDIKEMGLYNFRPSVRPVPLDVHIMGFPGKHYCPRMISMNRPTYQAIRQYAPNSPSLVFCSSRKQTRLTAVGLITYLMTDADPKQWLKCPQDDIDALASTIHDSDLRHFLNFGIGLHHAGLHEHDRKVVEELFLNQKIQVLIATATLAWGVNFPAHLVVIKGTEYFDGLTKRYVDMPITDVLQMMGRAGRPQYDTSGVACVFVQDVKKNFYKKFLYEPFPVESNLLQVMPDHVNAEIASGMIGSKSQMVKYLTWTYFFRRLVVNPTYYGLMDPESQSTLEFLNELVDQVTGSLEEAKCIMIVKESDEVSYQSTYFGHLASYYYLSHKTLFHLSKNFKRNCNMAEIIETMCLAEEYAQFPVRHNEDKINMELVKLLDYKTNLPMDSSHLKVILLIYIYLSDLQMPNQEYLLDLRSVFDQALRILQAMIDVSANSGWLSSTIKVIHFIQMLIQGQWLNESDLQTIPHVGRKAVPHLEDAFHTHFPDYDKVNLVLLKKLNFAKANVVSLIFHSLFPQKESTEIKKYLDGLPLIKIEATLRIGETAFKVGEDVLSLPPATDVEFNVQLYRKGGDLSVKGKKFSKQKEESWIIFIGFVDNDEIYGINRLMFKRSTKVTLKLKTPEKKGNYTFCLYLFSDSYLGLDQQHVIKINIT